MEISILMMWTHSGHQSAIPTASRKIFNMIRQKIAIINSVAVARAPICRMDAFYLLFFFLLVFHIFSVNSFDLFGAVVNLRQRRRILGAPLQQHSINAHGKKRERTRREKNTNENAVQWIVVRDDGLIEVRPSHLNGIFKRHTVKWIEAIEMERKSSGNKLPSCTKNFFYCFFFSKKKDTQTGTIKWITHNESKMMYNFAARRQKVNEWKMHLRKRLKYSFLRSAIVFRLSLTLSFSFLLSLSLTLFRDPDQMMCHNEKKKK